MPGSTLYRHIRPPRRRRRSWDPGSHCTLETALGACTHLPRVSLVSEGLEVEQGDAHEGRSHQDKQPGVGTWREGRTEDTLVPDGQSSAV